MNIIKKIRRKIINIVSSNPKSCYTVDEIENAEISFYKSYLRNGMTVFDVGSNIGDAAITFGKIIGDTGALHCFEPGEYAFKKLVDNTSKNPIKNIITNNVAVGDYNGFIKFHIYPKTHSSWNSVKCRPLKDYGIDLQHEKVTDVPIITLDQYCEKNNVLRINLLKIDTEGYELQCLNGAKKLFTEKRIDRCIFEFGQTTFDQGNSSINLKDFFSSVGYTINNIIQGDPLFPGGKYARTAQFAMIVARPKKN
jgi:FkbM family methyltransferase